MNFLGLIYLSYCAKSEIDQDFKIVKNLFDTALSHKDSIKNPLHLGCLYAHLGQLYSCMTQSNFKRPLNSYRNAIYNYQLAQKYGVYMPITSTIYRILNLGANKNDVIYDLFKTTTHKEFNYE